jgi:putative FmdB family regulatory protein
MPLYEYKCKKCGHRFEKIVKFSDPPVKKCPKCKKGVLEQLISTSAIQFKGSGFYATDYGGKSAPAEESGKKGEEGKSTEQKADEKSDQKSKDKDKDKKKEASPKEAPASTPTPKEAPAKGAKEKATADKRR